MRTANSPHKAVRRRLQRSVLLAISLVAAILVSFSGPAEATDISIPFDDLVFGTPGSVVSVTVVNVDADMVGRTCHLVVVAENQASVHIGNDLIVSTGTSQAVILGVEDTPNGGTSEAYEMVLGPTIAVELRIGGDGMSSLGFDLSFECAKTPDTVAPTIGEQVVTSTSIATSTTTSTTTPVAPTACTMASGEPGVVVGTDCCVADTTGTGDASGGTDCCTLVVGTAATGCAAAETPTTTSTTTATTVPATVAGSSTNQLPETPAARAVTGSPSYTG